MQINSCHISTGYWHFGQWHFVRIGVLTNGILYIGIISIGIFALAFCLVTFQALAFWVMVFWLLAFQLWRFVRIPSVWYYFPYLVVICYPGVTNVRPIHSILFQVMAICDPIHCLWNWRDRRWPQASENQITCTVGIFSQNEARTASQLFWYHIFLLNSIVGVTYLYCWTVSHGLETLGYFRQKIISQTLPLQHTTLVTKK